MAKRDRESDPDLVERSAVFVMGALMFGISVALGFSYSGPSCDCESESLFLVLFVVFFGTWGLILMAAAFAPANSRLWRFAAGVSDGQSDIGCLAYIVALPVIGLIRLVQRLPRKHSS